MQNNVKDENLMKTKNIDKAPPISYKIKKCQKGIVRAKTTFFRSTRYGLTLTQQRIVYYAILVGQQQKKNFEPITLSIQEFKELCGLDGQSSYSALKSITRELLTKILEVSVRDEKGVHFKQLTWFKSVTYHIGEGSLTLTLNDELKSFFEGRPFTDMEYIYLIKFKSQYAERLYELLKTFTYKDEKKELISFSIEDLRKRLGFDLQNNEKKSKRSPKYPNFYDFEKNVLNPAIQDINNYTNIHVAIKDKKRGNHNKVQEVSFTARNKNGNETQDSEKQTLNKLMKELGVDEKNI